MSKSQDKCVSSVHPPSCTPPSRSSFIDCDMVESLGCVPSAIAENLSNQQENVSGDVVVDGEKSNKVMQLSDITEVGSEEMELGDELPNHGCFQEDEIPRVGMRFAQLQMARDFYVTYAKKVEFATKKRMTTYDITKMPVNQAIHCNRDGFRGSRVKAPTRKNMISAAGCKARIYVKFDKDMQEWILFKVEFRHSHSCSARKAVHYHEYRQLTMHVKYMIEDNDEAEIRPNKTFLTLANEAGGPSNLGFSKKDLRNYITARLRTSNVNADVREMMNYFMRMKDINPNFFYAVKLDDECMDYGLCHSSRSTTMKCITRHTPPVVHLAYYEEVIAKVWGLLPIEESFEDNWSEFIDEYNLHNNTWLLDLYDDRRMWVSIYFKGEFWATMRSTQRSESMHAFYGGFLHNRTSLVQFVHEYDNVLGIKEQSELEDDTADSRGVIPCATSSLMERQFQQEYTTSMFRDVQTEFMKKADYRVSVVAEEGASVCMKVEEEKLVNNTILCVPYDVHFDRFTQEFFIRIKCTKYLPVMFSLDGARKIKRKHTYVKSSNDISWSDESHVAFKGLCAHFYNVAQEFVGDHDKTTLLHAALEETRAKLAVHRAKKRSESVVETHTSIGSQTLNVVGVANIQGPSKVSTKGRPKSKRLDAALEKSFKNSARRKNKNAFSVVCPNASQDVNLGAVGGQNVPKQAGGFMSLLNSFNKN
ncbi:protein FAR-RED IMPAIRED RESPONSE 1-like [Arachis stenosperma]|uniref:protein FAR-RED IMPAIRED RESPONSE 1-like n=1 Tax=Arachis stenosperma TaxID=217475 RepID=UPI0025ABD538|nr:protein FAR-RED IMPAIRED RESPONSE 1-like [Arachis stenosperma]